MVAAHLVPAAGTHRARTRRAARAPRHRRPADRVLSARRVLSTLCAAVVLVVLGGLALIVAPQVAGGRALVVASGSMGSAAPTGSVVVVRPVAAATVRVGDIVLVQEHPATGTTVLHRVTERTVVNGQLALRTKGDANPAADPVPYRPGRTTFTAVFDVPLVGYAVAALRSPGGLLAIALVIMLAVAQALVARTPVQLTAAWRSYRTGTAAASLD